MKFSDLSEDEQADLRKQVLAHAHALEHASFDKGIPRLRGETAVKKAIITAALVYSDYLQKHWDVASEKPDEAIRAVADEVRKDADERREEEDQFLGKATSRLDQHLSLGETSSQRNTAASPE
jgi:hypothetical protein